MKKLPGPDDIRGWNKLIDKEIPPIGNRVFPDKPTAALVSRRRSAFELRMAGVISGTDDEMVEMQSLHESKPMGPKSTSPDGIHQLGKKYI